MPELVLTHPEVFSGRPFNADETRQIERMAADAWRAPHIENLDGWQLRYNQGVTRRANSVLPVVQDDSMGLEEKLTSVEAFYNSRDIPVRYQISPAVQPGDLDAVLEQRGYVIEAPVDIQIAAIEGFKPGGKPADGEISVFHEANEDWSEIYHTGFGRNFLPAASDEVPGSYIYPVFTAEDGTAAGIGLGYLHAGWIGIFGMQTRKEYRNTGIGTALLMVMAAWAQENDAHGIFLQIEHENPDAGRLYDRAGFKTVYSYHYRTLAG